MAGVITHSWKGTVLTVTSDAGTSSADLAGATGCRGPQGRPGVVYDNEGKIIVSDLATLDYVDDELRKYDKKTLIRDEDGNLRTAVGGYVIEWVEGTVVSTMTDLIIQEYPEDFTANIMCPTGLAALVEGERYNFFFTFNDGTVVEVKDIIHQSGVRLEVAENPYITHMKVQSILINLTLSPNYWSDDSLTVTTIEIQNAGHNIYEPISAYALPVDGDTVTIDEHHKLATGPNVVVESRMAEYVDEQIGLAQLGGDAAILDNYYTKEEAQAYVEDYIGKLLMVRFANYYTKSEVDALVEGAGGSVPSSEGVKY